jgi:hypothetical protein
MTVLLALGLDAGSDGRVTARGLPGIGLPQVCAARAGLGFRCPACGLTRSLIRLSRGDLAGSLLAHRLGWLLGGAIALQVPYRWAALRRRRALLSTRQEWLAAAALVALVLVNWLVEIAAEGGFTAWPRLFYGP